MTIELAINLYLLATLLTLAAAVFSLGVETNPDHRRSTALAALTCWAWPVWLVIAIVTGARDLYLIATQRD